MSFPFQAEQRQSGFSAAEVLVATFIIAVALVALAGLFPVANQSVFSASQRTTAALLAEQGLELARNSAQTSWASLPVGTTTATSLGSNYAGYTRTTVVALVGVDPNLKQVTVTVTYQNRVSVQLITVIGN